MVCVLPPGHICNALPGMDPKACGYPLGFSLDSAFLTRCTCTFLSPLTAETGLGYVKAIKQGSMDATAMAR